MWESNFLTVFIELRSAPATELLISHDAPARFSPPARQGVISQQGGEIVLQKSIDLEYKQQQQQ